MATPSTKKERGLKTANSVRDLPLHPSLIKLLNPYLKQQKSGHLWPNLKTSSTVARVEVISWGHNLAKPCKGITGIRSKDFCDRFVTALKGQDFKDTTISWLWQQELGQILPDDQQPELISSSAWASVSRLQLLQHLQQLLHLSDLLWCEGVQSPAFVILRFD